MEPPLTEQEFDFLLMIIELTSNGEIQARVKQLNNGDFDSNLKLALNQARRIRRWVARNNPSEELRQTELVRAAKGFDHFASVDLSKDVRFQKITAFVDRLGKAYFIVDLAIAEIDVYVEAVKKRYVAKGGVDKEAGTKPMASPTAKPVATPTAAPAAPPKSVAPPPPPAPAPPTPPAPAPHKPSRADKAFASVLKYFVTSPDDVVRIIRDYEGVIEMSNVTAYQAGEILGAVKDHFYLDRENGSKLQISVAGQAPLPWFGETDTIESAVISARRSKQFSQEFESIRRTFSSALNRFDVR
jgi:hypothetical protein